MRSTATAMLAIAALVISWQIGAQSNAQVPSNRPDNVGLVNLSKIFNNYEKFKIQSQALNKHRDEVKAEVDQLSAEMRSIQERRANFKKDSPEYRQFTEQFEEKQLRGQQILKREQRELGDRFRSLITTVYKEVMDEVDRFSKERNFTLVLQTDEDPIRDAGSDLAQRIKTQSPEVIQRLIGSRTVLYSVAGNDITQAVTDRLNQSYRSGQNK